MTCVAVVGLGHVGLPVAVELGCRVRTLGFDPSEAKIAHFKHHEDPTGEVTRDQFEAAKYLEVSSDPAILKDADFIIVAVPTPVDDAHQPDSWPLVSASRSVGAHMKRGAIVVYESTVYPGATEKLDYHPQVILAGRRINDGMGKIIAEQTVKRMLRAGIAVQGASVIVLGLTFKEDAPDLSNSRVIDVIRELQDFGAVVHVHDPIAVPEESVHEYGGTLTPWDQLPQAAAVAAVSHKAYKAMDLEAMMTKLQPDGVFADVKGAWDPTAVTATGAMLCRL